MYIRTDVIRQRVWAALLSPSKGGSDVGFAYEVPVTCRARDVAIFLSLRLSQQWTGFGFFDLQRLLYLAQGWHITSRHSLLFGETIEAHNSAPLTRSVLGPIPVEEMLPLPLLPPDAKDYLVQFSRIFASADRGAILRQVEHEEGAWKRTLLIGGEGADIDPKQMQSSFRFILREHKSAEKGEQRLQKVCCNLAKEKAGALAPA
jgi:hypothetical protein